MTGTRTPKSFEPVGLALMYEGKAWRVTTNSDLIEGRGRSVDLGYYVSQSDALKESKGKGVFGSDANVECVDVLVMIKVDHESDDPNWETAMVVTPGACVPLRSKFVDAEELRRSALSKLSEEEKEALGLS